MSNRTPMLIVTLALAACGSASSKQADARTARLEQQQQESDAAGTATVYVVHGINGTDVAKTLPASLPVDVSVNGGCALTNLKFGQITSPIALPAGTYDLVVHLAATPACSGAVAASASGVELEEGDNFSVVADLSSAGKPQLALFANDVSDTEGKARVVARHAANFSAVDVLLDGNVAFAGVINGEQGAAKVAAGQHTVGIAPAGSPKTVFSAKLDLSPAKVYVAYAVGTPANGTFQVILQVIPAAAPEQSDDGNQDNQD